MWYFSSWLFQVLPNKISLLSWRAGSRMTKAGQCRSPWWPQPQWQSQFLLIAGGYQTKARWWVRAPRTLRDVWWAPGHQQSTGLGWAHTWCISGEVQDRAGVCVGQAWGPRGGCSAQLQCFGALAHCTSLWFSDNFFIIVKFSKS